MSDEKRAAEEQGAGVDPPEAGRDRQRDLSPSFSHAVNADSLVMRWFRARSKEVVGHEAWLTSDGKSNWVTDGVYAVKVWPDLTQVSQRDVVERALQELKALWT